MATENELLSEFAEFVNQITRLLLQYREFPVVNQVEKSIACKVSWKSNGHKISRGVRIHEEDSEMVASCIGFDSGNAPKNPQEAISWLSTQLTIYRHEILAD